MAFKIRSIKNETYVTQDVPPEQNSSEPVEPIIKETVPEAPIQETIPETPVQDIPETPIPETVPETPETPIQDIPETPIQETVPEAPIEDIPITPIQDIPEKPKEDIQEDLNPKLETPVQSHPTQPQPQPAPETKVPDLIKNITDGGSGGKSNWKRYGVPALIGIGAIGLIALLWKLFSKKKEKKVAEQPEATEKEPENKPEKQAEEKEPEKEKEKVDIVTKSYQFDNNSSKMSENDKKDLKAYLKAVKEHQDKTGIDKPIVIFSSASQNGDKAYNEKISKERATEIEKEANELGLKVVFSEALGSKYSTLASDSKDKHAASRADRIAGISIGLESDTSKKELASLYEKNLQDSGLTAGEVKERLDTFNKPTGEVVNLLKDPSNPEVQKQLEGAIKENPGLANLYKTTAEGTVKINGYKDQELDKFLAENKAVGLEKIKAQEIVASAEKEVASKTNTETVATDTINKTNTETVTATVENKGKENNTVTKEQNKNEVNATQSAKEALLKRSEENNKSTLDKVTKDNTAASKVNEVSTVAVKPETVKVEDKKINEIVETTKKTKEENKNKIKGRTQ